MIRRAHGRSCLRAACTPAFQPARSHVLRAATVRERMVVTPAPPLAYARGSLTRHIATPVPAGQLQSNLEARAHRIWQRRPCADAPAHGPARSVSLHRYRHPHTPAFSPARSHVLRAATVRERMVVTPEPPLAYARGSLTRHIAPPVPPLAYGTVKKRGDTAAAR